MSAAGDGGRTEAVVDAIRRLVIFAPDQSGAYRELFDPVAAQLGSLIETRLTRWLRRIAGDGQPGVVVLTGNAGTGKTSAAEAFCEAAGSSLPDSDDLTDIGSALVAKDVSGLPSRHDRAEAFREMTLAYREHMHANVPVHEWPIP